jgi:hypothetical protein
MTGVIQGTHAFKTRRDDGIQILRKYLKTDDGEALAETYAASARLIESKPYMPLEVVQGVLDALAAGDPRARAAKPEDFIDMRFVRELDASGFIDGVYR